MWNRLIPLSRLPEGPAPRSLYLNENTKTGFSINLPIVHTCKPTQDCKDYCYGLRGPIAFHTSLARQVQNLQRLAYLSTAPKAELYREIDGIAYWVKRTQDFLRWFGVGDLTPPSVKFINAMAKRHPDLHLWIASRKFDLAKGLCGNPNLHLMLSADSSTSAADIVRITALLKARKGQAFAAWVQRFVDEPIPSWVEVVFAEHKTAGRRALWTATKKLIDPRTCPATIVEGLDHEAACGNCRRCFDQEVRSEFKNHRLHSSRRARRR